METPDQKRPRRRIRIPLPRRSRLALVGAVLVAVIAPAAWASDLFTDVPSSNPHHDDINAIAGVGITTGCAPSLYCPGDVVSRQQMASFLRRGLGRVATSGSIAPIPLTDTYQDIATRQITAGGAPGGIGMVLVLGEFTAREAFTGNITASHQVEYRLTYQNAGQFSTASRVTLWPTTGAHASASASKTYLWGVPTGAIRTFTLQARRAVGAGTVYAETPQLTVMYVPFGPNGT